MVDWGFGVLDYLFELVERLFEVVERFFEMLERPNVMLDCHHEEVYHFNEWVDTYVEMIVDLIERFFVVFCLYDSKENIFAELKFTD